MNNLTIRKNETEEALERMTSKDIKDNYGFQIRHFAHFIRDNSLSINYESIRAYLIFLNKSEYSASGKRTKRQALKKRLKELSKGSSIEDTMKMDRLMKELDENSETKAPKTQSQKIDRTKCISKEDFEKLIAKARSDRQKRFIEFMYGTGARVSEMLSIKIRNIKVEGELARIRIMGKGKKERILVIPLSLLESIKATFQGEKYLFATSTGHQYNRSYVTAQIKKIGEFILHRAISSHTLRHSFATRMIQQTRKVQAVSQYLGHSSSSITLDMYVHEELTTEELFK
jgi:site-specific recombinase XerD